MRALLMDRLPNVLVANKTDRDRALNGVSVTNASLVQALLKYGSYDVYYYVRESSENNKAGEYEDAGRLQALDLGSLESLRNYAPKELVLFTNSHHLAKFVPFRQFCGHEEWPICGRTHGLSASSLIPSYAWNYFAALHEHDAIICTSSAGKQALSCLFDGLHRSRSVDGTREPFAVRMPVIHIDGIEIAEEPPSPIHKGSGFVVVAIGRLTASHKADLRPLIAAFLRSTELPSCATLILAGDDTQGHIAADLEGFAGTFPSTRKVVAMPDVSAATKRTLLGAADVALCMSDTCQETFGVSVLEGMAAGLPVVAPNWDGYRELVIQGRTGFLAKTTMYPDTGLLNAVSMLIDPAFALGQRSLVDMDELMHYLAVLGNNPSLAKQMGHNGRQLAQSHFSWKVVVRRLEECWEKQLFLGSHVRANTSPRPLGFMDYDRVFAHHPAGWLTPETIVVLRASDKAFVERALSGELFSPSPLAGFSPEVDDRILELCRLRGPVTCRELVRDVQTVISGPSMVATQISRLIKYGLLGLESQRYSSFNRKEQDHEVSELSAVSPVGI